MDLDNVDPELIVARGQYATVNGEYKTLMSKIQARTQAACDWLRRGLQEDDVGSAVEFFEMAENISAELKIEIAESFELKALKNELYKAAWGK
jgi:hypothetical protein